MMYRFPLVELIERVIKKAKEYGSPVYWGWVIVTGVIFALFIEVWGEQGFSVALPLFIAGLVAWLGGIYPISQYEKRWHSKKGK